MHCSSSSKHLCWVGGGTAGLPTLQAAGSQDLASLVAYLYVFQHLAATVLLTVATTAAMYIAARVPPVPAHPLPPLVRERGWGDFGIKSAGSF